MLTCFFFFLLNYLLLRRPLQSDLHFLLTPSAHPYTTALHSPPGSPRLGGGRRLSFNALFGGKPAKPMSPPSAQDSFELEDDSDQESGSTPGVRKLRVKRTSQGAVGGTRMERTKSVGDGWPLVIDVRRLALLISMILSPECSDDLSTWIHSLFLINRTNLSLTFPCL